MLRRPPRRTWPSSGDRCPTPVHRGGFYRYAEQDGLLDRSPAVHVRRPRLDYESHATGLDRNEVGALLVADGLGRPAEHALISLLAINGLRVSEALGADNETLGLERGHRTLTVARKSGKIVTIRLAPRTTRAIDLAVGERPDGPIFLDTHGERLDRYAAGRILRRLPAQAGINKPVRPHTLRHAFITAALDAGVPLRDVQEAASHADPRTTMRYDSSPRLTRPARRLHRRRLHRRSPPGSPSRPRSEIRNPAVVDLARPVPRVLSPAPSIWRGSQPVPVTRFRTLSSVSRVRWGTGLRA